MDGKKITLFLGFLIVLICIGFLVFKFFKPRAAGLSIEANIASNVYLDGKKVGITPFDGSVPAGDGRVLRLIPVDSHYGSYFFETKLNLISGIKTVVRENLGESDADTSGEVVSLQKSVMDDLALSVVSNPDAAQVSIDGISRGFTPIRVGNLSKGEHAVTISLSGYGSRSFLVKTVPGFMVTILVKLNIEKKVEKVEPSQNVSIVRILDTPTGFLRVREKPSTVSSEVGQVRPGETYELISKDEKLGWLQIKLDGKDGWISDDYATISSTLKK